MKNIRLLLVILAVTLASGCASTGGLFGSSSLPSCSEVSNNNGYGGYDRGIGREFVGSDLWVERRILYSNKVFAVVRAVAAYNANGEWQAINLAPDGLWQSTIYDGLLFAQAYDVNFDVKASETNITSRRFVRRDVEVYLQVFGPGFGANGREYTFYMKALKFRSNPDTDWTVCPTRY